MPTYVNRCDEGHEFETVQSMKDDPIKRCQFGECREPCRRVIQPAGIVLKGGGWARDGYSDYTPASEASRPHTKGRTK